MVLFEDRASTVLYKVLKNIKQKKFILPLNVCPIVPNTFIKAGKEFIFCDISLETLCIDEHLAFELFNNDNSIDGILFVKTFGINLDTIAFFKKIKSINKNIFIINDQCPCVPKFDYNLEHEDMVLFSSGYSKYIDLGFGGYGFLKDQKFSGIFNDKSNTKQFLEYQMKILNLLAPMKEHKKMLNQMYEENIPRKFHLGKEFNDWRFSILVNNKEKILKEIFKVDGLFASSHYPQVDYDYVINPIQNSNAKKIHNRIINLFNDFRFNEEKTQKVINIINKEICNVN